MCLQCAEPLLCKYFSWLISVEINVSCAYVEEALPADFRNMAVMLNISQQALLSLWHLFFNLLSHHITGDLDRQIKHKKRHKSRPCRPIYTLSDRFYSLIFPSIVTVSSVVTNELTWVLGYCSRSLKHTSVFIYNWWVNSAHSALVFSLSWLLC